MGLGLFVLGIAAVIFAFGALLNRNGRRADRERLHPRVPR
jgi:hypothetical protein